MKKVQIHTKVNYKNLKLTFSVSIGIDEIFEAYIFE